MQDTIIINRMGIGDVVLSTPLATILKQQYGCKVGFVVAAKAIDILENHPYIDDVYSYGKKNKASIIAAIKKAGYRQAIIVDQRLNSTLLALKAGCSPLEWGLAVTLGNFHLFHKPDTADNAIMHYINFLDSETSYPPEILVPVVGRVNGRQQGDINHWIAEAKKETKRLVLIAPQGLNQNKSWPLEHCSQLNLLLNQTGIKPIYVGSAADQVRYAALNGQILNIAGRFTLRELAALAGKADLCVSVCTGPMHVMASSGVPVLALYGATSPQFWAPAHAEIIQSSLDCVPCQQLVCKHQVQYQCMNEITPQWVFDSIMAKLM